MGAKTGRIIIARFFKRPIRDPTNCATSLSPLSTNNLIVNVSDKPFLWNPSICAVYWTVCRKTPNTILVSLDNSYINNLGKKSNDGFQISSIRKE